MPRDYKKNPPRRGSQCRCRGWFFGGLIAGVLLTAMIYYQFVIPSDNKHEKTVKKVKSASITAEKPRFDFYTILPEMEVEVADDEVVPDSKAKVRRSRIVAKEKPVSTVPRARQERKLVGNKLYMLQVASFRQVRDADKLKAKLALKGIETRIEKVSINDRQTYHRVRVGPFRGEQRMKQVRSRLRKLGLRSIVIRLKKVPK